MRSCERNLLIEKQKGFYRAADTASWARRFELAASRECGIRVLGFTTRFSTVIQHAMRDLAGALRHRGCEVDLIMEPDESSAEVDTWSALALKPYDLVIVINHLRSELGERIDLHLPYVCWCQDHMEGMWTREAGRSVGDNELVLTHSPWHLEHFYDYPRDHLVETANLTDAGMFSPERGPAEDLDRFTCDVSYISHGARTPEQLALAIGAREPGLDDCLMKFVTIGTEHLKSHGVIAGFDLFRLMLRAEKESGLGPLTPERRGGELIQHVLRLYDRMLRHETLRWTAEWAGESGG